MRKALIPVCFLLMLVAACEEIIYIDLDHSSPAIVIEGKISNENEPSKVVVTRTMDYFNPSATPMVTGAIISISNGTEKHYYGEVSPGIYECSTMPGIPGTTYTLSVTAGDNTYTATSRMPELVWIDSLALEYIPGTRFSEPGYFIHCYFTDPPGTTNYYRMRNFRNGAANSYIHILNDRLSDGQDIHYFFFDVSFEAGDTAAIELHTINAASYDYLLTLFSVSAAYPSVTGSAPANPNTNFSNGALGYFSAFTVNAHVMIIKKDGE